MDEKENGPTLLDVRTYRYKGHSMSDPQKYRTKDEVAEYQAQDPIEKVKKTILDNKLATAKQLETIDQKVKDIVAESVQFAEESPVPKAEELYQDVYTQTDYPFIREYE